MSGNDLVSLEESLDFQKRFYEISKNLGLSVGWYSENDLLRLRVAEDLRSSSSYAAWKRFTVYTLDGGVIYDSSEDFSKVVYGRYAIVEESLSRLKHIGEYNWKVLKSY